MKCPVCSKILVRRTYKTILLDYCPQCRGIWFDEGKFAAAANLLTASDSIAPAKTKLFTKREVQTLANLMEQKRLCPTCAKEMAKFNYSSDSNVFLDKCPDCGGIWADAGELQRAAAYLKEDPIITAIGKDLAEQVEAINKLQNPDEADLDAKVPDWIVPMRMILPISDDLERERTPVITISLIAICCMAFAGQMFLFGDFESFVRMFGFTPTNFWSLGLFTSMFLHGDILHLAGNMFFLWVFGDNVEDRFSRVRYLFFFVFCGFFGTVLHGILNLGSSMPAVGASGAIAGVMGAYLLFYPTATITVWAGFRTFELSTLYYIGGWFGFQLLAGWSSSSDPAENVAWFAHIGGFVLGVTMAFFKKRAENKK